MNLLKMAAHTTLLSFISTSFNFKKHNEIQQVIDTIYKQFSKYGFIQYSPGKQDLPIQDGFLQMFISPSGSHMILRGHATGLVTIDIHEFVTSSDSKIFNNQEIEMIEKSIKDTLMCDKSKSLPAIRRGEDVEVYYPTVDGRIMELDFKEVVHDVQSKYQKVVVAKSDSLGNVLILDGDLNMGESDTIYTHTLMQKGKINYAGKTCLVLGGGDGGLLYELVKEGAKKVTLVDIDEEVINAAKKHLRGVCYDVLDTLHGPNYEVIIGDAVEHLRNFAEKNLKFEFILYDLTAIPVTTKPIEKEWAFLEETIRASLKVLEENGKFLCHSTALLALESISRFEGMISSIDKNIHWLKHPAFIPSFHEVSAFYEIWIN